MVNWFEKIDLDSDLEVLDSDLEVLDSDLEVLDSDLEVLDSDLEVLDPWFEEIEKFLIPVFFLYRVNNCVSFTNYKFFVLFLGYAFSLCAWSAITSFEYFLRFWKNDLPSSYSKLHILFLFFVSIMFAVSLVSLYLYHLFLVFKNRSTLESFRTPIFRYGPDKRAYDLGRKKNWKQVFGETRLTWLIPVSSW